MYRRGLGLATISATLCALVLPMLSVTAATLRVSGSTSGGGVYFEQEFNAAAGDQVGFELQDGGAIFSTDSLARSRTDSVGVYTGVATSPSEPDAFALVKTSDAISFASVPFMITPPAGYSGGLIPISFSAVLDGSLSVAMESEDTTFSYRTTSSLRVSLGINSLGGVTEFILDDRVSLSTDFGAQDRADGVIVSEVVSSNVRMVDPTQLQTLQLQLEARSRIWDYGGLTSVAIADSFNSLSLPTETAIFSLPEGFTVNSVEAGIVNNMLVAPVPIPGMLGLFGGAILFLFKCAERREAPSF